MSLKKHLIFMLFLGCVITTVLILTTSIVTAVYGGVTMTYIRHLYRYPLVSFMAILPTLIFVDISEISERALKIRIVIHFFLTATLAILGLVYIGINLRLPTNVILIPLVFTGMYIGGLWTLHQKQRKLADQINERISENRR